jgi:hypothetical protein
MNSGSLRRPIRRMLPYQSPSLVVDSSDERFADLFQPDEQLLRAAENDHEFVPTVRHGARWIASTTMVTILIWICARNSAPIWTRSGPRLSGRSGH